LASTTDSFLLAPCGALPAVSSASAISSSCMPLLLCLRTLFGGAFALRLCEVLAVVVCFGGPGAIGTTPPDLAAPGVGMAVVALEEPPPTEPVDFGDSESAPLPDVGVVAGVCAIEFFRDDFFDALDVVPLTGAELPLPRLRFLMTSVLSDKGRTTPCSLRNKPQALHRGWPSGLRRQSGVVWVK
jgi:hypothetical protein